MSSPERERAGRWIAVLVASLAVHVGVLSTLSAVPHKTAVSPLNTIDVTFTVTEPAPREEPPAPPSAVPDEAPVVPRPRRKTRPRDQVAQAVPSAPASKATDTPIPSKLDPETVARAFFVFQQAAPTEALDSAGAGARGNDVEVPNYFKGVGEKHYLSRREPPSLKPHQDGTYRYRGTAFKAIVERDGSVTFDDGYRQSTTISFDITDLMMRRRGEDPYRVEKNWFLEGTAEFRKEMFERWRAKQTLLALRKLRGRLVRICEDGTLSDEQKEARVIAIFRDTADDEAGAAARKTITKFVEEEMPATVLPGTR